MQDFLIQTWTWLLDEKKQKVLTVLVTILGGAIVAVIGGAWALYKHFFAKPPVSPPVSQKQNTTFGNNSPIQEGIKTGDIAGAGHTIQHITNNYGISQEYLNKALKEKEEEVKQKLKTVHASEKELAVPQDKIANKNKAYKELLENYNQIKEKLTSLEGKIAEISVEKARKYLEKGDIDEGEKLLKETLACTRKQAALIAFELGAIAEQKVKYDNALHYYRMAVELEDDNS